MQGYVKLHRKIFEHPLWHEPNRRKSRFEAWAYLMSMANHKNNRFLMGRELVTVKRGQHLTSQVKLAQEWNRDRETVKSYLNLMSTEGMIEYEPSTKNTLITICNYELYQGTESDNPASKPTTNPTTDSTPSPHQISTDTNTNNNDKNDNNVKNDKNLYIYDLVKMTKDQHKKLFERLGEKQAVAMIEQFNNYIHQIGEQKAKARYKSHYHVILNWISKNEKEGAKYGRVPKTTQGNRGTEFESIGTTI